ncbi:hypothetical protein IJJ08_03825 [bacterium]|nr:hypothetical protein [bacterium]
MSSDRIKRYLDSVAKQQTAVKVRHKFALACNMSFSFANLNVAYEGFDLRHDQDKCPDQEVKIDRLVNAFELLSQRSIGLIAKGENHCHPIEREKLVGCGMKSLVDFYPNETFYQLGSNYYARPERIIGYYDRKTNIFQVCIIDLHHQVYPK